MLFELIRVAIGTQDNLSQLPSRAEWGELYKQAMKQSLVGVCFAGLQRLGADADGGFSRIGIDEMLYLTWMGMAAKIQQKNESVNQQCVDLQSRLSADGERFCILKGQGAGLRYPSSLSLLRQSGDIDVWMAGGMEHVVSYVNSIMPTNEVTASHVQLHVFDKTEVEMHYVPVKLSNRLTNKRLKTWLREQENRQMSHTVPFGDGVMHVPTLEFDVVYQLLHIYKHLFNEGIGLRQLMDYYFLMQRVKASDGLNDVEMQMVNDVVASLGLEKFASAVMWVLQKVFALGMIGMPWVPNQRDGEFLLDEIMNMGNFGHADERFRMNKDDSHLKHFWQSSQSKWRFIGHFPSEVLWQPIDMFLRFFEQKALRKKALRIQGLIQNSFD